MRILLLTFTGTGNTKICGDFIADEFLSNGHEVIHYVYNVNDPFNEDINSFDMIGVGYPIHAFNTPQIFTKWMKSLPKVTNKLFFVYKVSGEPFSFNNASSNLFVKKLKRKGYKKIAEKHFLMPYNIMFRYKDEIAKQMYLYLKALTKLFVQEIIHKDYEVIPYHLGPKFLSLIFRIEWIAPKVNAPLCKMNKNCTKCGLCMDNCPMHAIYISKKGKMKFKSSKCSMCMRCTMNCPTNAIRFGIMNAWKINGMYDYDKILKDESINPNYINENTKGYFHKFNKYFRKQNLLLAKYKIDNPLKDYLSK